MQGASSPHHGGAGGEAEGFGSLTCGLCFCRGGEEGLGMFGSSSLNDGVFFFSVVPTKIPELSMWVPKKGTRS